MRVRDTGIGIEPDMLTRIFDLFVQANSTLARSEGGLGVGLTLVQHVVRLHGGTVVAISERRGRGSEFEMRLPIGTVVASDATPLSMVAAPARARRILLIEDNRDARQMLRTLLELGGHRVDDAGDAKAGMHIAVTSVPDVVLVDIGLPDLDGYEVATRLRTLLGGSVRLVALTGYGDDETRRRAIAAGFDEYLVKPVAPETLARTLDAL